MIDSLHRDKKIREAIAREPDGSVAPVVSTALNTETGMPSIVAAGRGLLLSSAFSLPPLYL